MRTVSRFPFFTQDNGGMARDLIAVMTDAGQQVPAELHNMRGGGGRGGKGGKRGGGGKGHGKGGFRPRY